MATSTWRHISAHDDKEEEEDDDGGGYDWWWCWVGSDVTKMEKNKGWW